MCVQVSPHSLHSAAISCLANGSIQVDQWFIFNLCTGVSAQFLVRLHGCHELSGQWQQLTRQLVLVSAFYQLSGQKWQQSSGTAVPFQFVYRCVRTVSCVAPWLP